MRSSPMTRSLLDGEIVDQGQHIEGQGRASWARTAIEVLVPRSSPRAMGASPGPATHLAAHTAR